MRIFSDSSTQIVDDWKVESELPISSAEALNRHRSTEPKFAFDKDVNTYYRSKSLAFATTITENPWIELYLNTEMDVGIVAIVNRLGCKVNSLYKCAKKLQNTKVEAFSKARTVQKACGLVDGVDGYKADLGEGREADETYFVECGGARARIVRLTDVDNIPNEMNVAEVRIYGIKKGTT